MEVRICKNCGESFVLGESGYRLYCSDECKKAKRKEQMKSNIKKYNKNVKREVRKCERCGESFVGTYTTKTMCDFCRAKETREIKKARKKADLPSLSRKRKKGRREEGLTRFLAEAREKGMTYAEAQVQETIQRVKDIGSSTINKDMIWG